ncbi:MAG: hydroxysqualene dehydroxylase HpnE [Magnetococcus sp. WYHC-3]
MSEAAPLILGAGMAGMAAAAHLAAAGSCPVVLESAREAGGRARSWNLAGRRVDQAPHLLVGAYTRTLEFLHLVGAAGGLRPLPGAVYPFWDPRFGAYRLDLGRGRHPFNLLRGMLGFGILSWRERWMALVLGMSLARDRPLSPGRSVTEWLFAQGQSPHALAALWGPLCLATLNEPPASADALLFREVLRRLFTGPAGSCDPMMFDRDMSRAWVQPAQSFITRHGGQVCTGERVRALECRGRTLVAVVTNRGRRVVSGPVIAALPRHVLARLLPEWAAACGLCAVPDAPIVGVHLFFSQPMPLEHPLLGLPTLTSQWLVDAGSLQGAAQGHWCAVLSGAWREVHWSRERLEAAVMADLALVRPDAVAQVSAVRVVRERRATFAAWPDSASWRPATDAAPCDNLFLAGDWVANGLPATLEAAVVSARRAVDRVLAWEGGKVP